jgi:acetyltransferase-like isoleucine patch superfamily enzyme
MGVLGGLRGRELFARAKPLLDVGTAVLRRLPRPVSQLVWTWSDFVPGYGGIGLRYMVLRRLAASCGDNVRVGPRVEIGHWDRLRVGNNVSIHPGCYLEAAGGITIGDDVSIAHHSSILSTNHTWSDDSRPIRDNPVTYAEVVVDSDVWIGCGVRVLAGVRLHERTVVAAGAVVHQDVPTRSLAGGVPAKVLKQI